MVEEHAVIASFSGGLGAISLVQVVVTRKSDSSDSRLNASGAIPGGQINMRPWDGPDPQTLHKRPGAKRGEAKRSDLHDFRRGLRMVDSKPWTYPNMCYRERWLPENKTMLRCAGCAP
jgi:hypothetical protein